MPKKRKTAVSTSHKIKREYKIERSLAENIIQLQKIHANMAEKFDKLAGEISQLLALFEITARTFTKNMPLGEHEKDKEFLEKIDKLLDQNKVLAKGLTLMEERLRERMYGRQPSQPETGQTTQVGGNRPLPKF
jgi:hypothetical protein